MKNKHCKGHVNCQCEGFAPNKWTPNKCSSCFHWKTHHTAGLQSQIPTVDAEPISVTAMKKNIDSQNKARPAIRCNNLSVAAMKHNFETLCNETRSVSVSALKHKLFSSDNKKKVERSFKGMCQSELMVKTCDICLDVKGNIVTTYECKHNVCKDCMRAYIYSKKNKLKIICPAFQCKSLLSQYYDIKTALSNKEFTELYSSTKCLSDHCNNTFQMIGRSTSKVYCNQCGETWCIVCKVPWHEGMDCSQYTPDATAEKDLEAAIAAEEQKSAFHSVLRNCGTKTIGSVSGVPEIRLCPECGTLITHTDPDACKYMYCTQCESSFCFVCLASYDVQTGWPCGTYSDVCPIAPIQMEKEEDEQMVNRRPKGPPPPLSPPKVVISPLIVAPEEGNYKSPSPSPLRLETMDTSLLDRFEDLVNKEMADLISLYNQLMDYTHQLIATDTSGIITCPSSDCTSNTSHVPSSNANDQSSSNQTPNNGNSNDHNDNNSDENEQHGANNNGDGGDEKEADVPMSQSNPCNHLSTCSYCRIGWTQKCEQIKIFKALLLSLQTQHSHHVSFVETLCKAIANVKQKGNKKSKSKNRRKTQATDTIEGNQPSYEPQNVKVKIPRALTDDAITQSIKEPIASHKLYSYLNKSIAMQRTDKQLHEDKENVVVNVDFHATKTNESLYCVMSPIQHQRCNWQLSPKLYTAAELACIGVAKLPQSSRIPLQKATEFSTSILNTQSVNDILRHCKWNRIPVFNITKNTKRMTLSIEQCKLNPMIKRALLNMTDDDRLIPILMFDRESHWVEHVALVHIDMSDGRIEDSKVEEHDQMDINIGISLRCDARGLRVTGIHLNKEKMSEQHQLLHPHACHCLDGFNSTIHDIRVGNPDTAENKLKDLKQKYNTYKEFVHRFINSHSHKYDTLQEQAQVLLMNGNGTLPNTLKYMDFEQPVSTPSSSISSSPEYCLYSP